MTKRGRTVNEEVRIRALRNILRGWNAYMSGRPGLALFFLRKAVIDLQFLIRKIEKQTEEET